MKTQKISLFEEFKIHIMIAMPLAATYMAEIGMVLTDNAIVGRLGSVELASVGLMGNILWEALFVGTSIISIVGVLVAQAYGANDTGKIGHHVRQGFWVATAISIPGTALCFFGAHLVGLTDQDPRVLEIGNSYLRTACWSFLPNMLFIVLRSYTASLMRVKAVMMITVGAVGLNAILTYGMVNGVWGFPQLGVVGAGWSTSIVSWMMFFSLLGYTFYSKKLKQYHIYQNMVDLDLKECWQIIKLGTPIGGIALMEGGLFMTAAILMGTISAAALAANQVVINIIAISFMASLAVGEAAGIRVAHGVGAKNMAASRQSGLLGFGLSFVIGSCAALFFIFGSHLLAGIFLDVNDPDNAEVIALCTTLFAIAAAFQLVDGIQAVATRCLRGMKDVVVPMWIAGIGYWGFGVGGGYILGFIMGYGPEGIWWGLAAGLSVTAILLTGRYLKLSKIL